MTIKHTKGPWHYDRDAQAVVCDGEIIADIFSEEDGPKMAAAPELLEALRKCRAALSRVQPQALGALCVQDVASAIAAADVAIAKAELKS